MARPGGSPKGWRRSSPVIEQFEDASFAPEIIRLKGELSMLQGMPGAAGSAEARFRQALDRARGARSPVLGVACGDEPRPLAARSRPPRRRHRLPPADLRSLHGGLRYRRSDRGETAIWMTCAIAGTISESGLLRGNLRCAHASASDESPERGIAWFIEREHLLVAWISIRGAAAIDASPAWRAK